MSEPEVSVPDRRVADRVDRRKHSRSGRRANDPRGTNWKRAAWLFGAYAAYLSVRSLPSTLKKMFERHRTPTLPA